MQGRDRTPKDGAMSGAADNVVSLASRQRTQPPRERSGSRLPAPRASDDDGSGPPAA